MKKVLIFAMFAVLFVGFVFALENNSNLSNNSDDEEDDELLGTSCGTVTPGTQNECCINKGYPGWDEEEFKCIGERNDDEENETENDNDEEELLGAENDNEDECEAWNCTKWSTCINGNQTRQCTKISDCPDEDNEQPRLTKSCYEKEELRRYNKTRDCPEECVCSGSTIKCLFENGTREMTVYAGNSGNMIVQIKNINMSTNVTLYKNEEGKLYGTFRGNITHEVKLPDEIKERLQNQTHRKLYNESINLDEDGYYHIQTNKRARLFWLVPVREHMTAEVNAETGETVKIRNPWWGFLARDVREKNNSSEL